jgi:hypothetical protein
MTSSPSKSGTAANTAATSTLEASGKKGLMAYVQKWDKPWMILCLLFFVTAALGLPVLWYSRSFSQPAKIVVSIIVIIYTMIIFACFGAIMYWCYLQISRALSI